MVKISTLDMSFKIINSILQPHSPGVNELMMLGYKDSCLAAGPVKEGDMSPTKIIISTIPFYVMNKMISVKFLVKTLYQSKIDIVGNCNQK